MCGWQDGSLLICRCGHSLSSERRGRHPMLYSIPSPLKWLWGSYKILRYCLRLFDAMASFLLHNRERIDPISSFPSLESWLGHRIFNSFLPFFILVYSTYIHMGYSEKPLLKCEGGWRKRRKNDSSSLYCPVQCFSFALAAHSFQTHSIILRKKRKRLEKLGSRMQLETLGSNSACLILSLMCECWIPWRSVSSHWWIFLSILFVAAIPVERNWRQL